MDLDLGQIFTIVAAIGNAVLAGVYLGFSVMVMPALRARPPRESLAAMQEVNRKAMRPAFMLVFFGAPVLAGAVVVLDAAGGARAWSGEAGVIHLAGAIASVAGLVVTIVANVPINTAVERFGGQPSKAALAEWPPLAARWTTANTLRGALCALAALLLLIA